MPKEYNHSFAIQLGKRLKNLREAKKFTQAQLAESLEIGRGSVGNYENGERIPSGDVIVKFSDFFGVSCDFLLGRNEGNEDGLDLQAKRLIDLRQQLADLNASIDRVKEKLGELLNIPKE